MFYFQGKGFDWFVNRSPQPPPLKEMENSKDHILMIKVMRIILE